MPTRGQWFIFFSLLLAPTATLAASKEIEQPDREMLRMMDFLKDLEVIKNMEMMKDIRQLEQVSEPARRGNGQAPLPAKRKEGAK